MNKSIRETCLRIYTWLLVSGGIGVIALAAIGLARESFDWRWLALTVMAAAGGWLVSVRFSRGGKEVSFSEAFVFLALILCGANAALIVAAAAATVEYYRHVRRSLALAGNVAIVCFSFFASASLATLLVGDPRLLAQQKETWMLQAIALALTACLQALFSSLLALVGVALKTGRPVWRAWSESGLRTLACNCSGAISAAVVTWLMSELGFAAAAFVFPILLIHHLVYRPYIESSRRQAAELQRSEARFRSTFEHAATGMALLDLKGRWLQVNQALCRILGCSAQELLALNFQAVTYREDLPGVMQQLSLLLEGRTQAVQMKKRFVHKLGYPVWAHWSVSLVRDGEPKSARLIFQIQDLTEHQRDKGQLLHDSFHDTLTGLPNRALFMRHLKLALERAARREISPFAVLMLDPDRFKLINESLGHQIGDQFLAGLARRLEKCLQPGEQVARLGGGTFTLLVNNAHDISEATEMAARVRRELTQPFNLNGHEVFTTVSIGIAHSSLGYEQPEEMLRDAETAMSRAKSRGTARHEVFEKEMHAKTRDLLKLETDLRRAIEREEFIVHYQPIVTLETGLLYGFEALVRWEHPEQGMISPGVFIPVAEETGLIVEIGFQVLREACRQTREWRNLYPASFPLKMSVNLSGKQFLHHDLIGQIEGTLRDTRLDPDYLKLEITESVVMDNVEVAIEMLRKIRKLGIELSIDDFGTGYSSLSYLHRFPLSTLKIDRSFVTRMNQNNENREIVRTIVTLAKTLKMDVIAEGVETQDQAIRLWELGARYVQGYYFSKPLPARAAGELLKSQKQWPLNLPCRVLDESPEAADKLIRAVARH
ncbi:MAG TPA: EAL domain-containing protein [Blastocatellia bacterium]|nr:EAL domain-containing protein [Blastocatellia bacterium]